MKPYLNVNGLTAHLLPASGMVRFCPNPQVPEPSRLNSNIGRPERPMTAAVLTLASAVWSAAKEVSAPPAGAEATCLPPAFRVRHCRWRDHDRGRCSCLPPSLEGFERLGERSRDLDPSGHRGVRVLDPYERDARAVRNDQFLWDLEAARFRSNLDLLR